MNDMYCVFCWFYGEICVYGMVGVVFIFFGIWNGVLIFSSVDEVRFVVIYFFEESIFWERWCLVVVV